MVEFERFRKSLGLSVEQAARLWAEGVRSPAGFLERAGTAEDRPILARCLGVRGGRLAALLGVAEAFLDQEEG